MTTFRSSATQISTYLRCKRQWIARYCLGHKLEQTEPMAFGLQVHKMLERYMRDAIPINLEEPWQFNAESDIRYPGKSAFKALKYIPDPKTGRAEHGFTLRFGDIEFLGYIDLEYEKDGELWITDYKSTGAYRNQKSAEDLAEDVQATLYATKAFLENQNINQVNVRWLYILSTKKPTARTTDIVVTREGNREQLKGVLVISKEMQSVKEDVRCKRALQRSEEDIMNSFDPTVSSCGRCDFTNLCKLTEEQLIQGEMEMPTDFSKYLKNEIETKKETVEKAESEGVKVKTQDELLDKYKKTVSKPKKEKREEPKVQLNAPEHYVDNPQTSAAEVIETACQPAAKSKLFSEDQIGQAVKLFERYLRSL